MGAMANDLMNVETQCFLSYTRKDNAQFNGVVDRLKDDLAGRFEAATGRPLHIFLDRETIGWGEDWRKKIQSSIESATFLIPVVTMRYFQSDPCREELIAFYESAKQLGVTELILPVILTGASKISADDPREEVKIIERLNHRNIEEAWLQGYESPAWVRMVHTMVNDLAAALEKAEAAIAAREQSAAVKVEAPGPEEDLDLFSLSDTFENLAEDAREAMGAMEDFGKAAGAAFSGDMQSLSRQQQQARFVKASHDIAGHAAQMFETGGRFERNVAEADAQLRAIVTEVRDINLDMARSQLDGLLKPMSSLQDMSESLNSLGDMIAMLRFASVTNVSLRKAMQPAIKGMQSLRNAIEIAESWRDI
jgi:hypothetical protein